MGGCLPVFAGGPVTLRPRPFRSIPGTARRTELDRLRKICNRLVAVTLCDVGFAAGVESVEVLGIYRDRLVIVGDRVIDLAQRRMGIAAIPICHAVLWIDADRLIIVGDRAAIVLQAFVSDAAAIVSAGIFGFALDDLAAIRNGEVVLAIVAVGNATRGVQPKQIWIELDRLAVVCDRGLPSAFFRNQPLLEERLTPLAETKGVFWIDCDRLGDIGDRLVEFTLFRPRHAAAGIGPHLPGIEPDRLRVGGQRSGGFLQDVVGDAAVVVCPATIS